LCLFGATKKAIHAINRLEAKNIQTKHIVDVVNGFMKAAVPNNIVKSFLNAGIMVNLNPQNRELYCHVAPELARCVLPVPNPEAETDPPVDEVDPNEIEFASQLMDESIN
jgi:hypothetical protein